MAITSAVIMFETVLGMCNMTMKSDDAVVGYSELHRNKINAKKVKITLAFFDMM